MFLTHIQHNYLYMLQNDHQNTHFQLYPGQEKKEDLYQKWIQRQIFTKHCYVKPMEDVPFRNILGLVCLNQYLVRPASLPTSRTTMPKMCRWCSSTWTLSSRSPWRPRTLLTFLSRWGVLKWLVKLDPIIKCIMESLDNHIISRARELHLEICLVDLVESMPGCL